MVEIEAFSNVSEEVLAIRLSLQRRELEKVGVPLV
jgi:hypothetical protein